ncbi:threonylcarbamoyl-AMP synthase [Methylobacterium sp. C25]|uniref:L-threonylcarbamoyladenylate synthase n=1 Tax=Methylobacterium sp. C25 TaxID=2721622 RepID=UPI001F2A5C4D|nr:L-threonylcarbamoyladenylate synthase [Methylobacterium sp. C25]MCE4225785.1 threonylcarbamoyl-AMP synthase [Methylobacterium sp. C25]
MNDHGSIGLSEATRTTSRLAADADGIAEAARLLGAGQVVAIPTETVYGLGADASDPKAVAAIYAAKDRPRFNPLISHLPDAASARREGVFDESASALAEAFWPGPLTLVLPVAAGGSVCDLARAGLPSVALRVPGDLVAREVLSRVGRPIAAPSANRSGRVSPTSAEHVLGDLDGRIAAVLDGGPCPIGIESTVIACLGGQPRLLRPGGITREELRRVLGVDPVFAASDEGRPIGPGLLASHYAPRAAVRLDAELVSAGEAALLFGAFRPDGLAAATAVENLSLASDLAEAAAQLFEMLRRLDASGAATIAVAPIPSKGLGEAINDRLSRAAAPR